MFLNYTASKHTYTYTLKILIKATEESQLVTMAVHGI